jgi:hypothetical protein
MADAAIDLSVIFDRLSTHSRRPRFAFMVLNLLSEAADSRGRAGPLVTHNGETLPVRLWLGSTLARMGEHHRRRADMRRRVAASLEQAEAPAHNGQAIAPPTEEDLDKAVQERAKVTSGANVSRAVSDLVKCGLVKRSYAGRWTGHHNRGGERHAVYTVEADALAALRRGTQLL